VGRRAVGRTVIAVPAASAAVRPAPFTGGPPPFTGKPGLGLVSVRNFPRVANEAGLRKRGERRLNRETK